VAIQKRMEWSKLLSNVRLGDQITQTSNSERTSFLVDYDRIIFSSPFRRLGKKTQVHPLNTNDHVHTRLTHSLEVASVGRSLGNLCALKVQGKTDCPKEFIPEHVGQIVQAACLGHDIGNPPFGHAGEEAIKSWFSSSENAVLLEHLEETQKLDFLNFEGNAQGFRVLTRLEHHRDQGGMRLTCATLAATLKYPWISTYVANKKKFCSFLSEKDSLKSVAQEVGLIQLDDYRYTRHPLAHLVEAADDICYRILDLEDAHEMNILSFAEIKKILGPLCTDKSGLKDICKQKISDRRKLAYIRAKAISSAINAVATAFDERYEEIMAGELQDELISCCDVTTKTQLDEAKDVAKSRVFHEHRKVEIEIGCYAVIGTLLSAFCYGAKDKCMSNSRVSKYKSERVISLLCNDTPIKKGHLYESLLVATDYLSGMTDNYAAHLAKQLGGMAE